MSTNEEVSIPPSVTLHPQDGATEGLVTPDEQSVAPVNLGSIYSAILGADTSGTSSGTHEIVFGVDELVIMPDPKKSITEDMEPEFILLFDRLIPDVDILSNESHEIFEGLASQQIKSWMGFILMPDDII